jgi:hypothetical protein
MAVAGHRFTESFEIIRQLIQRGGPECIGQDDRHSKCDEEYQEDLG